MLSDRELMRLQIGALYLHNDAGRMLSVNEPNGARAPRFFLGMTAEGNESRYRDDIGESIVKKLDVLCERTELQWNRSPSEQDLIPFQRVLERIGSTKIVSSGPAYKFPRAISLGFQSANLNIVMITEANRELLRENFAPWYDDARNCQPFAAIVVNGQAISICASVRISHSAYEAGVETQAAFRGQGYAAPVVARWMNEVRKIDRIPVYSTSWGNHASMAVAEKLGLVQFGADLHID